MKTTIFGSLFWFVAALALTGCCFFEMCSGDDCKGKPATVSSASPTGDASAEALAPAAPAEALAPVAGGEAEVASSAGSVAAMAAAELRGVTFAVNRANLTAEAKQALDVAASYLRANPNAKVVASAHCDSSGNAKLNEKLGMSRASAVKAYLIEKGVAADRIATDNRGAQGGADRKVELSLQN